MSAQTISILVRNLFSQKFSAWADIKTQSEYYLIDLPLPRLVDDINGSKTSINCDIFCLFDLFFFLLDLAVDEIDADDVEHFCFAIVSFSSTRRICDCTVAEGLKLRRLETSANLYFLLSAAVETEADDDDLTETDGDDCSEAGLLAFYNLIFS